MVQAHKDEIKKLYNTKLKHNKSVTPLCFFSGDLDVVLDTICLGILE